MRLSPPFVVRMSRAGEPDEYLREKKAGDVIPALMTFTTMADGLAMCDIVRGLLGVLPAVVPLAAVPTEER